MKSSATIHPMRMKLNPAARFCLMGLLIGACLLPPGLTSQTAPATLPDLKLSRGGTVKAIVVQPDGKLIVGGLFESVNGLPRFGLARLNPNGSTDATWFPSVGIGDVRGLALSGTDLFVGGGSRIVKVSTSDIGSINTNWISNANGSIETLQVNGTNLYAGGGFSSIGGQSRSQVARFDVSGNGTPDSWNPNVTGPVNTSAVLSMAVSGMNVFIGGLFTNVGGLTRNRIAKLSAAGLGAVDPTWNPNANGSVRSIAISGTNVYTVGGFNNIGGQFRNYIARLSSSGVGVADPSWNPGAVINPGGFVNAVALSSTNVYLGGLFTSIGGLTRNFIARVSASGNGMTDSTWNPDAGGIPGAATSGVNALLVNAGDIYIGGGFETVSRSPSLGLAKVDAVTGLPDRLYPAQAERTGLAVAIALQPDGKVVVGGVFSRAGGLARRNLVRVNQDGTIDATWDPSPSVVAEGFGIAALAVDSTNLFVGGLFNRIGGQNHTNIAKLSMTDSAAADPSWIPSANDVVHSLAVNSGAVFAGGFFTTVNGQPRHRLAKVSAFGNGALDPSWNPDANSNVWTLAISGANLFVGGTFTNIGGLNRNGLAKVSLNGVGAVDSLWNPNPSPSVVLALAPMGTDLFVGGGFTFIGTPFVDGINSPLAKVATGGSGLVDNTWNPFPSGPGSAGIQALAVGGSALYVGGLFTSIGGLNRSGLAKLPTTGAATADPAWSHDAGGIVYSIAVKGTDIYAGGNFAAIAGVNRGGIAFLPVASAPLMIQSSPTNFFLTPNPPDRSEITHFRITGITGGSLYLNDGVTAVNVNDFITVGQGLADLVFVGPGPARTVTAAAALNATPAGTGTATSTLSLSAAHGPVFRFSRASYRALERRGYAVVTIEKHGDVATSVDYSTSPGSAAPGVDYQEKSGTLRFSSAETRKDVTIGIVNDFAPEPGEGIFVSLGNPTAGATIASPNPATVQIVDDDAVGPLDSFPTNQMPNPATPPPSTGVLVVDLVVGSEFNTIGQWRLVGEFDWHDGGASASGLTTGNYRLEFKPVNGYRQADPFTVPVMSGITNRFQSFYARTTNVQRGNLFAIIKPDDVAEMAGITARGQWQRQDETNWHNSGEVLTNLPVGGHTIRFKEIPGRLTPASQNVEVAADQATGAIGTYLFASTSEGPAPTMVGFSDATSKAPYLFNGQIQSDVGFGSGVVVKERVVLTAAHVLFDDFLLSYVKNVHWFFNRYKGAYEPVPQTPRGWYVFEGYAAQRESDNSPGVSSSASQNLDAAAMYFLEPAGRGGFSGYLSSDWPNNEWLVSNRLKMLVGYPLETIPQTNQGKMHATDPADLSFAYLYQGIFTTTDIRSFPGNSGGPLFVQGDDTRYYPAAIYLGGSGQTLVRAINSEVVDLINRAENSGNGGANNTGGGVSLWSELTAPGFVPGLFRVHFLPSSLFGRGAGWRVRGGDDPAWITSTNLYYPLIPGDFDIEFKPLPGFITPPARLVRVEVDHPTVIDTPYDSMRLSNPRRLPDRSFQMTLLGETGRLYTIQWSQAFSNWSELLTLTNRFGSTNLIDRQATNSTRRFYRAVER